MQQNNNVSKLVDKSVSKAIVGMAIPMLAGTFVMTMHQLTNAWFVSRLGNEALAAISFTFPVVMFIMLLVRGLGSGAIPLVAHAIGERDNKKAAILTTYALIPGIPFAAVVSLLGILTITPLFSRLGASGEVLSLIARYMKIWFSGTVIVVLQMVIMDIIISTGNTKAISFLPVSSTVLNAFLDMVLIFGMFGMPKMGIAGAALAMILSLAVTLVAAFYMLIKRLKLIDTDVSTASALFNSWGEILRFGIPGSLGMIMNPISAGVITKLAAGYGTAAVAAMRVATKIEMFALMIPMTVGIPLVPFMAQAKTFSTETAIIDVLSSYIYITSMGFGMAEVHRYSGFTMIGTHKPLRASALAVLRVVVLLIPLTIAGSYLFKLRRIFRRRFAADVLAGLNGIWWSGKILSPNKNTELQGAPS